MSKNERDRTDYYITILPLDDDGRREPSMFESFPEHAKAIAFIIAEWNQIEFSLSGLLSLHIRVAPAAVRSMVYAIESSGGRLDLMRAAFTNLESNAEDRAEILGILDEAQSVLRQRNKYAHGLFGKSPDGGLALFGLRRDEVTDLPLHDLNHQVNRVRDLSFRVRKLASKRLGLFGTGNPDKG